MRRPSDRPAWLPGARAAGRRAARLAGRPARRPEARHPARRWTDRPRVLEYQRVHDECRERPPPALLASFVHRARAPVSPGQDRSHPAGAALCAELGAPHITTEPGGPLSPGQSRSEAIDLFVEVLKPLAEHAESLGVLLLIEPEPGLLLETTDQYLEVAERLNAPSIGLNFDVGHAFCVSEDLPGASPSWPPTSGITTSRISPRAASTITSSPARAPLISPRSWRPSARTGYDGWLTVELYPFLDDPDARGTRCARGLASASGTPDPRGLAVSPMPRTIVAYLQLIRLRMSSPPRPTVWRAGCLSPAPRRAARWLPLLAASMVLYASGIMLNDVFDFEVDRLERPGRPLPSGRASRRTAAWVGGLGLRSGPCLALASGSARAACVAAALALDDPEL